MSRAPLATRARTLWAAVALAAAAGCSSALDAGDGRDPAAEGPGATPKGAGCPDDLAFFEREVWKPTLQKKCIVCHAKDGLAKKSRMVLEPATAPGYLEKNLATVTEVAKLEASGTSVLLLRPTGRHPEGHTGGTLVTLGGAEYDSLATFVARVTKGTGCEASGTPGANPKSCTSAQPGRRRLRRLTSAEYTRTLRDLFGLPATFTAQLAADPVVAGFGNNAAALRVSPLLADQLRTTAEDVAKTAAKSLPACTGAGCADKLLQATGKRIFRRPLTADERTRYAALYATVETEEGAAAAAEATVAALLQSPGFLYRPELGDASGKLGGYEIASELSYLLWGSMPDDALFAAAEAGALGTAAGIEKEARRLLADPRSAEVLGAFLGDWMDLGRLPTVAKDMTTYPDFDATLRAAMREEATRFADQIVRADKGTFPQLLTSSTSFVNGPLAALYGVSAPAGGGFAKVDLGPSRAGGLLTLSGVLSTHGLPTGSSPIHRGKLVRERLLCQPLPPPPPSLNVQPPPVDPTKSTRERYAAHATVEPCVSCHKLIDPIGFAFERFDGIGRARDTEAGKPVDTTGEILATSSTDGKVTGAPDLAAKLAQSPEVHACFATQWVRFAYGLDEAEEIPCLATQVATDFAKGKLEIGELLVALTQTPHFLSRLPDTDASTGAGGATGSGGSGNAAGAGGAGPAGAAGAASGGSPGTGGQAGAPPATTLEVSSVPQGADWDAGGCRNVTVKNAGKAAVTWTVSVDVPGTMVDVWNAEGKQTGAQATFSGKSWNASIGPGEKADFGFCFKK